MNDKIELSCQGREVLHNLYNADTCEGFSYDPWPDAAIRGWERVNQKVVCSVCAKKLNNIALGLLQNSEKTSS